MNEPPLPTPPEASPIDLRILTPGLDDEEIAAVISVVTAAIETQQARNEDGRASAEAASARRWRHSMGPLATLGLPFGSH